MGIDLEDDRILGNKWQVILENAFYARREETINAIYAGGKYVFTIVLPASANMKYLFRATNSR